MSRKILWFTPVPLPQMCQTLGLEAHYGGWWVDSLLREMARCKEVELAVAWPHRGSASRQTFSADGVKYYSIPEPGRWFQNDGFMNRLDIELGYLLKAGRDRRAIAEAEAIVNDFQPDLVQVFGTEMRYGLIASLIRRPVVVWIQGILDVNRHHFFGTMGCASRLCSPRLLASYYRMTVDAAREREIFRRCKYFIGRTTWDAAQQLRLQPKGRYYPVQECIRPDFLEAKPWHPDAMNAFGIYTTTSASLWKGTDVLIRSLGILRERFPRVFLRIAGFMGRERLVARRLRRLVDGMGLSHHVTFLGQCNASEILRELQAARVFVLPSFIENSSNSLAEAQLVGTPTVAAFVGGIPDMVVDSDSGLLFHAGDHAMCARQIGRILTDDSLATRLSARARKLAHERHSPARIALTLLRVYDDILSLEHPNRFFNTVANGPWNIPEPHHATP